MSKIGKLRLSPAEIAEYAQKLKESNLDLSFAVMDIDNKEKK